MSSSQLLLFLQGVEKDIDLAIVYYKKACSVHYSPAAYNLGCLYGNKKLPQILDEKRAEEYFKLAAQLGGNNFC